MQWALHVQSTSLCMSHLITPGHFPHSMVGFRRAGTITPVADLGIYLQASPAEQFEEIHSIVEHPVSVVVSKGPRHCPPQHQPTRLR
jgi:hypothetical protein